METDIKIAAVEKSAAAAAKLITGQVVYMGPRIGFLGLGYANGFRDGIWPHLYEWIARCPAIGEMFVRPQQVGAVRRELNFDYAHNMKGTTGRYVIFYKSIQQWLASQKETKPSTIEQKHHA